MTKIIKKTAPYYAVPNEDPIYYRYRECPEQRVKATHYRIVDIFDNLYIMDLKLINGDRVRVHSSTLMDMQSW